MRVIAGAAKSLPLKTVPGMEVRPTTDRIKETLFNMIANDIPGCRFLDLFAGSGAIGIEALSRGAKKTVFVDQNANAIRVIKDNLSFTKLAEAAVVFHTNVAEAIKRLSSMGKEGTTKAFDIIFMDPPYDCQLEQEALFLLSESPLVHENTTIIVEASLQTDLSYLSGLGFTIQKEKKYKTNRHMFIKRV